MHIMCFLSKLLQILIAVLGLHNKFRHLYLNILRLILRLQNKTFVSVVKYFEFILLKVLMKLKHKWRIHPHKTDLHDNFACNFTP